MSPINQLSVLAFAAGALAVPRGHAGFHAQYHHSHHDPHFYGTPSAASSSASSDAPYPVPSGNATVPFGTTGTGFATGAVPTTALTETDTYGYSAAASYESPVSAVEETSCSADVTVTTTERSTVYITAASTSSSSSHAHAASTITVQSTSYIYASSASSVEDAETASASASSSSESLTLSVAQKGHFWHHWHKSSSAAATSDPAATTTTEIVVASSEPASTSEVVESTSSVVIVSSAAPVTTSSIVVVSSAAPETTSSVVIIPSAAPTTSYAASSSEASSSAYSSTSTTSSASSSATGKRGLAYNDASLTSMFASSEVSWAYNWGSSSDGLSGLNFIPLLWGTADEFTGSWKENAQAAIAAGAEYLFSFNEPDDSSQANLSPADAASAYQTYMQQFAGGDVKLCAPSVTNGGGAMGLDWLSAFLDECTGCQIDCVSIHWYDSYSNADYFKNQVSNATTVSGGKPVFVTEFGCTDGDDDDISTFLEDVMPWMDSNSDVAGYSYFMVSDGLMVDGTAPSSYGSTFMSYTSS